MGHASVAPQYNDRGPRLALAWAVLCWGAATSTPRSAELPSLCRLIALAGATALTTACAPPEDGGPGAGGEYTGIPADTEPAHDGGCALTASTSSTGTVNAAGCALLERDTSACKATREAAGLSGFWLDFSCRVSLSVSGDAVVVETDGLPDYKTNYFDGDDACHVDYTGAIQNPNLISTQDISVKFPWSPDTEARTMGGTGLVGLALNGVVLFANFAAPGDDIFNEAKTFDACGAHPEMTGTYHYHSEPYSITQDDSRFVGVMRDGYPIYGRRDADGTVPSDLDSYGGHTGTTPHSDTPVYHYHVHAQSNDAGETQYFITAGWFRGSIGECTGCF